MYLELEAKRLSQSQKGPMCLSSRGQFQDRVEPLPMALCWAGLLRHVPPAATFLLTSTGLHAPHELGWQMAPMGSTVVELVPILLANSPQENFKKIQEDYHDLFPLSDNFPEQRI